MDINIHVTSDNAIQHHLQEFDHSLIGIGSGDKTYTHVQSAASSVWSVVHNLNKYPSVSVFTNDGEQVLGDVEYTGLNTATLRFSAAFSGKATLN